MAMKKAMKKTLTKSNGKAIVPHTDGTPWAKGEVVDGKPNGYWEWFRLDGSKMRSGTFKLGIQIGEWTTYDRTGRVVKVTQIKPKK